MLMNYFSCSGATGSDSTKSVLGHVMTNLCFCIWLDLRAHSAFRCVRGAKRTIFHTQVGLVRIPQKNAPAYDTPN
jgi:hypothetical protein